MSQAHRTGAGRMPLGVDKSFFRKNCSPRKCPAGGFRVSPEMITKLIQILGFVGGAHLWKQTPRHFSRQMEFHF